MSKAPAVFGLAIAAIVAVWASSVSGAERGPITTKALLAEMTDLAGMAEFPSPPFTCKQFSSYDRAAKSPSENWFANGDCGQYLRVESRDGRKEHVMMDAEGPGAIVRIWSANPAGVLRIYLDGSDTPALVATMSDLLGGKFPGLPRPIAGEYSKGWNLYFPIPYAKHCKVTSDQGNFYYHVNYRTYARGTPVESFRVEQIAALAPEIQAAIARMEAPEKAKPGPEAQTQSFDVTVAPGQSAVVATLSGPRAITRFGVRWTPSGDRDEPALRSTLLEMTCDGRQTIQTPLGDFFGTAPGLNPYQSLPLGVTKEGALESRWVMPWKTSAELRLRNLGRAPVTVRGALVTEPYRWTDATMLFHAKWRAAFDFPTDPKVDWNYLTAKGQGVFAGVAFSIDNPVKDWWGEGDEKIYVDGETFPSHFGTGTEDYYGYAWCYPLLFTHAYHNQTRCDGPGNYGRTSVNRWHILDRIPFQRDFRFDMEIWHWKKCQVNLAVTSYWYARPGATDTFRAPAPGDVVVRPVPEMPILKVRGAIEGEKMRILQKTGRPEPQDWDGTSEGRHLWWHDGQKPGDVLVLGFPVAKAGKYKITAQFLKAVDYGIAQVAINGVNAGRPIDFYNDGVIVTGPVDLGSFDLKQGENTISFTIVGANPKAIKAYMVGLDYLLLTPVP
ncbi:MAG: DUF2961 domain-containing protein [Thermoguttaceae bacterium]|jgi:hypothetical protein|nr:DUF2961 domain-containing protein [Thermoguttaceae bacterium]